jgi:hypothetical protein
MPVVPMVLISSLLMVAVSFVTRKPSKLTISRYFHQSDATRRPTGSCLAVNSTI